MDGIHGCDAVGIASLGKSSSSRVAGGCTVGERCRDVCGWHEISVGGEVVGFRHYSYSAIFYDDDVVGSELAGFVGAGEGGQGGEPLNECGCREGQTEGRCYAHGAGWRWLNECGVKNEEASIEGRED